MLRLPHFARSRIRYSAGYIRLSRLNSLAASILVACPALNDVSPHNPEPSVSRSIELTSTPTRKPFLSLPLDHHMNPLLEMLKLDILALSNVEFSHLSKISHAEYQCDQQFLAHITEIILEKLTSDTALASRMLQCMNKLLFYPSIVRNIRETVKSLRIKASIFEFMAHPASREANQSVREAFQSILHSSQSKDAKLNSILTYFHALAASDVVNWNAFKIDKESSQKLLWLLSPEHYHLMYAYFFNINAKGKIVNVLTRKLALGSPRDQYVLRTGWVEPKWHETLQITFKQNQIQRMVAFMRFEAAESLACDFIRKRDVINANLYLGILVAKLERVANPAFQYSMNTNRLSAIPAKALVILKVLAAHAIAFKGPDSCVDVLRYMIKHEIGVSFRMLLTLMRLLRERGNLDEALIIANNISLETASEGERAQLVEEMLRIVAKKYPSSPKVFIGYTAAMLAGNPCIPETNQGLELLDDLDVLGLAFRNVPRKLLNYDGIQKVDVDEKLTGFNFTPQTLVNIYEILFASLNSRELTFDDIQTLYTSYMDMVSKSRNASWNSAEALRLTLFRGKNLNDKILTVMIKYLLQKPGSNGIGSPERYRLAKLMMEDFDDKIKLSSKQRSPAAITLLIRASLFEHHDPQFAFSIARSLRSIRYPMKFEHYFPFIKYHFERNEHSHAKVWYDELVRQCTVTKANDSRELFSIARKLHWEVTGFVYRKTRIHNNYAGREALASIQTGEIDPFKPISSQQSGSSVPEEHKQLPSCERTNIDDQIQIEQESYIQDSPDEELTSQSKVRLAQIENLTRFSSTSWNEKSRGKITIQAQA